MIVFFLALISMSIVNGDTDITDKEVLQLTNLAQKLNLGKIVQISALREGCDCAESTGCDKQLTITVEQENKSKNIVMSRTDGEWDAGVYRLWRQEINKTMLAGKKHNETYEQFEDRVDNLLNRFPKCK